MSLTSGASVYGRAETYLELFVDTLQAINGRVQRPNLVTPQLQLLPQVVHLVLVRLALSSVLRLQFVLT